MSNLIFIVNRYIVPSSVFRRVFISELKQAVSHSYSCLQLKTGMEYINKMTEAPLGIKCLFIIIQFFHLVESGFVYKSIDNV